MDMKRAVHLAGLAVAAVVLTGCATVSRYESLAATAPGASLTVRKSYSGTGVGSAATQFYSLATDEYCDTARQAAALTWTDGDERTLRVAPDQPLYVWISTTYFANGSGAGGMDQTQCTNLVRFTPARDGAYSVSQNTSLRASHCTAQVIDLATGQPVPDAQPIDLIACRQRASG